MSTDSVQQSLLGWDEWFSAKSEVDGLEGQCFARVVAVDRDQLHVINTSGEFRAKLSGRFLHMAEQPSDFPCVGDWVRIHHSSTETFGIIHSVIPRKTFLCRKVAGDNVEYQMIAANIDVALIVQSCQLDFNVNRLERYLVMAAHGHVHPVILLTKTDLIGPETLQQILERIRGAGIAAEVIALSNVTGEGVNNVRKILQPGKTYCLLGSSGVGKSTLINQLIGRCIFETKVVSGTGEGRHTTVRRELIVLDNGAMMIDNPGMRELGILGAQEGIGDSFADIHELSSRCRYGDCSHSTEPGCAVLSAIEDGTLHRAHYENFCKLRRESEFHDRSYLEKRRKDRNFSRHKKTAKKDLGILGKRDYQ